MLDRTRPLSALLLALALAWHLLSVLAPPKIAGPTKDTEGRDFASYYYAVQAAADGENPYDKAVLDRLAQREGLRETVHPFFYPPPYLLLMTWALPFDLRTGYYAWYVLNELCLLGALAVLARWWRAVGSGTLLAVAATTALMTGVQYSLQMGQVNFIVLLLVVTGLWRDRERQPILAGVLVGLGCMLKMSPALFVFWWLFQRKWLAVGAAVATAVVTSLLALPLVSGPEQVRFYTDVLPQFSSGDYNGLVIRIDMFGNHSLPNLLDQLSPGVENRLSPLGRALSTGANLALIGGLGWLFRKEPATAWAHAAQSSAIGCAALLIPVYTYEHHLIWALPALSLALYALAVGRLGSRWALPLGLALGVLCYPLPHLKALATEALEGVPLLPWLLQESKFFALLTVFASSLRLARED